MITVSRYLLAGILTVYVLATVLHIRCLAMLRRVDLPPVQPRRAAVLSFRVILTGLAGHTGLLVWRWLAAGQPPVVTGFDAMSLVAWSAMLCLVLFARGGRRVALGAFGTTLGLILLAYAAAFPIESRPLVPTLQSHWQVLRAFSTALGSGALAVGGAAAAMYLLRVREGGRTWWEDAGLEAGSFAAVAWAGFAALALGYRWLAGDLPRVLPRVWLTAAPAGKYLDTLVLALLAGTALYGLLRMAAGGPLRALGSRAVTGISPAVLDQLSYAGVAAGFPLLTLGTIVFAMLHAQQAVGAYWAWEPTETWGLIAWLVYTGYLHLRRVHGWEGRRTAWVAIIAFPLLVFALVGAPNVLPSRSGTAGM